MISQEFYIFYLLEKDNIDRWFYKQDQKNTNRTNSDNKSKVKRFFRKDGAE